jgi:hypothetical protein
VATSSPSRPRVIKRTKRTSDEALRARLLDARKPTIGGRRAYGGAAADLPQKRDAQSFTRSYLLAPGRGSFLNNTRATKAARLSCAVRARPLPTVSTAAVRGLSNPRRSSNFLVSDRKKAAADGNQARNSREPVRTHAREPPRPVRWRHGERLANPATVSRESAEGR